VAYGGDIKHMSPQRVIRKKIGELLIERKIITKEQLSKALQEQQVKGGYISQHIIAMGFATEFDIAHCLSSQYGFPYLPLKNYSIAASILEIIPFKFIKIYSILPIDKLGDVLTVTMADPLNDGVIEMLKQITNLDIEVFISTYSDINHAISRYFAHRLREIDKYVIDEEDLLKEGITRPFIQTVSYSGMERRRFTRVDVELDMTFFLQGEAFKAKIKNICFIGIFFICDSFIPLDTNILSKIKIKDKFMDAVIQIARVEKIKEFQQVESYEITLWKYGIAGFFNFITDEDRKRLAIFLKDSIKE
jgi:hypothetical protein